MTNDELMCLIVLSFLLVGLIAEYISLVMASRMMDNAMKPGSGWVKITENGKRDE